MSKLKFKRIVIKVGTSVLTAGTDRLQSARIAELMRQIARLHELDTQLVLVTSGAVLAGWEALGFPTTKRSLGEKQLFAAVGQSRLMHLYGQLAGEHSLTVAQTLLTRDDLRDRRRYLNARNTFLKCIERGILPIVNENDVVAVDEIKVGDNDTLSALVASLIEADLLLICTDRAGLFTADPRVDAAATLIRDVVEIDESIFALAGGSGSHRGTGGMVTKVQAADLATRSGIEVVVAAGDEPDLLVRIACGEPIGTRFHARAAVKLEARKRWILAETVRNCRVEVDAGAEHALLKQGKSLLPAGVVSVAGAFERGQTIRIFGIAGRELARGLTQYKAEDLVQIASCQSAQIEQMLGYTYGPEVVHRDDMVMLG